METILKIENLHCWVQDQRSERPNLEIKKGEVHAIMGLMVLEKVRCPQC